MALARIAAMAMGIVGALGASQGPEFAQQYTQRLGGAIDELETIVERFDDSAAGVGLGREDALARLEADEEVLVRSQGQSARLTVARLENLRDQRERLSEAGDFSRVLTLLRVADPQIAQRAYLEYRPALPVTSEGMLAAGLGFVLSWLATFGAAKGTKQAGRTGAKMVRKRLRRDDGKGDGRGVDARVYRRDEG